MARYRLTLEPLDDDLDPEGIRRLRSMLKRLLRSHRLRCLAMVPVMELNETDQLIDRAMLADGGELTP